MEIITSGDLAAYLDDEAIGESARADLLVELANDLVTEKYGETDDDMPARVKVITLEVAARAWRNPEGYSSETIDDYTYRRDADTRQAGIYLTVAELAELTGSTSRVHVGWLA